MLSTLITIMVASAAGPAENVLDTRALIEQALDEPTRITLENVQLGDAIDRLSEQTGVRLVMPPEVMALVPYGASTTIQKVEIANIPLRIGLGQLFDPLGMTFAVRGDHVAVAPKEALLCLGRAPSWDELDLLGRLSAMQPGVDATALEELRSLTQFQVSAAEPWATLAEAIRTAGAGSADQVLSVACANLGWSWCLSHDRVAVMTVEQRISRQLQQTLTMKVSNRSLFDVLDDVSRSIHVPIRIESGAPVPKTFSMNVSNAAAERVLDKVAAETGLAYLIDSTGVLFYPVNGQARAATSPTVVPVSHPNSPSTPQADPWFCKIVIQLEDGKSVEFPVRESEVPPDLREFREQAKEQVFEMLRRERAEK